MVGTPSDQITRLEESVQTPRQRYQITQEQAIELLKRIADSSLDLEGESLVSLTAGTVVPEGTLTFELYFLGIHPEHVRTSKGHDSNGSVYVSFDPRESSEGIGTVIKQGVTYLEGRPSRGNTESVPPLVFHLTKVQGSGHYELVVYQPDRVVDPTRVVKMGNLVDQVRGLSPTPEPMYRTPVRD